MFDKFVQHLWKRDSRCRGHQLSSGLLEDRGFREGYGFNGAVFVYSLVESDPSAEWVGEYYSASPLDTLFQFGKAVAGANVVGVPIGVVGASG